MKTNTMRPQGFTLVELLVVIVIIAALAGLSAPMILRQQKAAARTEAISNAKQIGLGLLEFDQEYGSFPDKDTAEDVAEATGSDLNLTGDTSNDYLRQLIAFGIRSEEIFFTKTPYTRKPDKNMSGAKALEPGEVGFGYIMTTGDVGQSTSSDPGRPVLATPLLNASTSWEFDPDPYGSKAVVLRIDNSAESLTIGTTGNKLNRVTVGGGKNIEQTGEETVWGTGTEPILKAPGKRGG